MSAPSRALAALTLATAMLLPGHAAAGLPSEDVVSTPASASRSAEPSDPVVDAAAGATRLPGIATRGWVLADLDTGDILAMQDADLPLRPASTLKLLTALTVAPRLAPEQPYRAVKADETAEGNRVVLYEGLEYTVADLLHAALLPSANDAAEALARANGGLAGTVEQMNAEAARLGAVDTTARNPSGLDEDGQFTTAFDMAVIGRAAFANPEIAAYLKLRTVDFPGKRTARGRVIYPIYNHNRSVINNFDGTLGGKSGYTTLARRTFVSAAERDGRRLLVSLLDIGGNTYTTGEVLLDWGFANADKLTPVGRLPEPNAPAPQFERTIAPLPATAAAAGRAAQEATVTTGDAPTASASSWSVRLPTLPSPGLPSPLTVLTLLAGVLVVLRARVYWIGHRSRWARSARPVPAAAPAGRSRHRTDRGTSPAASRARGPVDLRAGQPRRSDAPTDDTLIGAGQ